MHEIKRYQVSGVPGEVVRVQFGARTVDYWIPRGGTDRLLIAHDGQNVFDGKTSTHRGQTWKMAQSAIHVSQELGINPPAIIAVWHSSTKENPWGRAQDLVPQKFLTPAANDIVTARARPLSSLFFTKLFSFKIWKPLLEGSGFLVGSSHSY